MRRRRHVCLLSQQELAEAVSASPKTIREIELGRTTPSVSLALAIATTLDTTVEELFGVPY